ncbi:putative signal transducing protein [Prosthecomicrobium sp. N25]|uniref:putative signal transducing protein n=1 Tax=Prosthecomicrobium sp. N25 TaxID=3129254 RepID=UPI0030781E1A
MQDLIRSNDIVLIATVEALLNGAGIGHLLLDSHMAALEGSLGILPRRILVDEDDLPRARRLVADAGLGHELAPEPGTRGRP